MTTPSISDLLKYADLQMAAEAFLTEKTPPYGILKDENRDALIAALVRGNDHASKFTSTQAEQFVDTWIVVAQQPNTETGFSGTLFKNRETGELVMSFRSTEFVDDAARDNQATNDLEIKETGFAWGQIRDMEAWYAQLSAEGGQLAGQPFSVTGYSLGGHLATVFNLLHPGAAQQVVTFNGAGVGQVKAGNTLGALVQQFADLSTPKADGSGHFSYARPELAAIYERVRLAVKNLAAAGDFSSDLISLSDSAQLTQWRDSPPFGEAGPSEVDEATRRDAGLLLKAVGRVETIRAEVKRLQTVMPTTGAPPVQVATALVDAIDLDYQLAVMTVSHSTVSASLLAGAVQMLGEKAYLPNPGSPQWDVVGDTDPSMVSNSQWHIGTDVRVFIEDQPLYRGGVGTTVVNESIANGGVKLLVSGYDVKDFGDTHSLVLLVDSLNVQNLLLQMLPAAARADAAPLLTKVLREASNLVKVDGDLAVGSGAGKAEGDVLERVVNALALLVLGPTAANAIELMGSTRGNTWAETGVAADHSGRVKFYEVIQAIKASDLYLNVQSAGGVSLQLTTASQDDLAEMARKDFGVYVALYSLGPFIFSLGSGEAAGALLASEWATVYTQWKADKDALLAAEDGNPDVTHSPNVSNAWLQDRADFLKRKSYFNDKNADYNSSLPTTNGRPTHPTDAAAYDVEDIVWEDRSQDLKILRGQTTLNTRYVVFGSAEDEDNLAGGARSDHLYGGAGNDTLQGLAGADHLEGNDGDDLLEGGSGSDSLLGGSGSDTLKGGTGGEKDVDVLNGGAGMDRYLLASDFNHTVIIDADGQGSVSVGGNPLQGGRLRVENLWVNDDGTERYVRLSNGDLLISVGGESSAPRAFTVRGYFSRLQPDALGLHLSDTPADTPDGQLFEGDFMVATTTATTDIRRNIDNLSANGSVVVVRAGQQQFVNSATGNLQAGEGLMVTHNAIWGTTGADTMRGLTGNDLLDGGEGRDLVEGGIGNDMLSGGAGSDTLLGGDGDDVIETSAIYDKRLQQKGPSDNNWDAWHTPSITPDRGIDPSTGQTITSYGEYDRIVMAQGPSWGLETYLSNQSPTWHYESSLYIYSQREVRLTASSDVAGDYAFGGAGNDAINGGRGNDLLDGGADHDILDGYAGNDTLIGADGSDLISGDGTHLEGFINYLAPDQGGMDLIDGGEGNDLIAGGGDDDLIYGGADEDKIYGDHASDLALGAGDDVIHGDAGADILFGEYGDDLILGGDDNDRIHGDQEEGSEHDGNDLIQGDAGNDRIAGGGGRDTLFGGKGHDLIFADSGQVNATDADNWVYGGEGEDTLLGGAKNDYIEGGSGADALLGDRGLAGTLFGQLGMVSEIGGNDTLLGGSGGDALSGGAGDDLLVGGDGDDYLNGGIGNDTLYADSGRDVLDGGEGDDRLIATGSSAVLRGGAGQDTYDIQTFGSTHAIRIEDDPDSVVRVRGAVGSLEAFAAGQLNAPWMNAGSVLLHGAGGGWILLQTATAASANVQMVAPDGTGTQVSVADLLVQTQARYGISGSSAAQLIAAEPPIFREEAPLDEIAVSQFFTSNGSDYYQVAGAGELVDGKGGNDWLVGGVQSDTLVGGEGDDSLSGSLGDDRLTGGIGVNTLEGGRGNDVLTVAGSDDLLRFSIGDGQDTIATGWPSSNAADVAFTRIGLQGVSLNSQVRVQRGNGNTNAPLYLYYGDQGDRIEFSGWNDSYRGGRQRWEQTLLTFDDGQTRTLLELASSQSGTAQDDVIYGPSFEITQRGGAGDDVFYSGSPDNVFEGGIGNDTFNGGATYLFSAGWGHDQIASPSYLALNGRLITLDFGQGIASGDVTFERFTRDTPAIWLNTPSADEGWIRVVSKTDGSSVEVPVSSLVDPVYGSYSYRFRFADRELDTVYGLGSITFDGDDVINGYRPIERFWDFSTWSTDHSYRLLDGQGGNDVLTSQRWRAGGYPTPQGAYLLIGGSGNDTLSGASGDTLEGGAGNDHLVMKWTQQNYGSSYARFSIGDGQDTIESDYLDVGLEDAVLVFGPGVAQQSVHAEWVRTSPDLNGVYRVVVHYGDQGDQVTLHTSGDYYGNAPDTRLRFADGTEVSVRSVLLPGSVTPETDGDDVILGSRGQDSILSGLGNDRIVLDDSDSYTYRIGHGNDVVETVQGTIRLADVSAVSQVTTEFLDELGNEMRLSFAGSSQTLLVRYEAMAPWPRQIYMADGSLLPVRVPTRTGTEGDDNVNGTNGDDDLRGLSGNDYLAGYDGNDLLDGGAGADYMAGGAGDDTYSVDTFAAWSDRDQVIESYGEGIDTIIRSVEANTMLEANVENLELVVAARTGFGNELDNVMRANDAGNYLDGLEGNDTLSGGLGADSLRGDAGDDLIQGERGNDYIVAGVGSDTIAYNRGDGVDTMSLEDLTTAVDTLRFGAGILEQDVVLQNISDSLYISVKGDAGRIWAVDHFLAVTQDSEGYLQDNKLDRIEFASGVVWDAVMIQTMVDRAASNRAPTFNSFLPTLSTRAGSSFSYTVAANTIVDPDSWDSVTYSIRGINGAALPAWLSFDAATRTLSATPGVSNVGSVQFEFRGTDLYGKTTYQTVTLNVATANRAPVVSASLLDQQVGPGTALSYTFGVGAFTDADADQLSYSATMVDGSALPSWLSFNAGTRTFSGTAPATLGTFSVRVSVSDAFGGSVNDVFDIAVSNLGVTRTGTSAAETLTGTAYADSLSGMAGNDTLVGNAGNDTLDGGAGTDNMQGGAGDDTYVVDVSTDVVTEAASSGADTVRSSITYTLGTNLENLLLGTSAINGTGNTVANVLTGNAGVNTLSGLGGADTMIGGAGNDTYVVENIADVVIENASEGTDLVQSSVSYSLSGNVENLTLTGTAVIDAMGNSLNNVLTGNGVANVLDGGFGADTMVGGAGNDSYSVDSAADVVTEAASAGTDTVYASVSYSLTSNVERLTLTGGSATINGTGNTLANTLTGNAGDNVLNGGTGADTMAGGLGNDTYVVDATTDVVTEAAGAGIDTVQTTVTLTSLAANVENLTLLGTSALTATGNTLDNVLTGNSGANTLTGGAGADTLIGGAGADSLVGGAGNDTYRLGRGSGADTVTENDTTAGNSDRALFDAGISVEQLWFRRVSNNLEATIIGTADKLTLTNWYLGSQYQVEKFEAADGQVLLSSQVQNLVQAMAAFSPPAAGQTTLPTSYQNTLNPVIAANWN